MIYLIINVLFSPFLVVLYFFDVNITQQYGIQEQPLEFGCL